MRRFDLNDDHRGSASSSAYGRTGSSGYSGTGRSLTLQDHYVQSRHDRQRTALEEDEAAEHSSLPSSYTYADGAAPRTSGGLSGVSAPTTSHTGGDFHRADWGERSEGVADAESRGLYERHPSHAASRYAAGTAAAAGGFGEEGDAGMAYGSGLADGGGAGGGGADDSGIADLLRRVGYDSDIGRMMTSVYGRPKFSAVPAPRLAAKPWKPEEHAWQRPMQSGETAVDPREQTINRAAQALLEASRPPAVPVREVHVPAIDTIVHRKPASRIAAEAEAAAAAAERAQPPLKRGYNPEVEKRKLQALFTFKGGRALPDSGMPAALEGNLPLHLITGKGGPGAGSRSAAPRTTAEIVAAMGLPASEAALLNAASPEELQLVAEAHSTLRALKEGIGDLRRHLAEVAAMGAADAGYLRRVEAELVDKQREMGRISSMIGDVRGRLAQRVSRSAVASASGPASASGSSSATVAAGRAARGGVDAASGRMGGDGSTRGVGGVPAVSGAGGAAHSSGYDGSEADALDSHLHRQRGVSARSDDGTPGQQRSVPGGAVSRAAPAGRGGSAASARPPLPSGPAGRSEPRAGAASAAPGLAAPASGRRRPADVAVAGGEAVSFGVVGGGVPPRGRVPPAQPTSTRTRISPSPLRADAETALLGGSSRWRGSDGGHRPAASTTAARLPRR